MVSALHGLHVLDLSDSVAGQFCGRMLADYGADVTLVEPPVGTATRRAPPFHPSAGTAESLLFQHLNVGKSSINLDHRTPSGRRLLLALAERSDVAGRVQMLSVTRSLRLRRDASWPTCPTSVTTVRTATGAAR
jgi:crotonobetainyl-CoA:carnitine CoA-transferase CaiB-like acyl-CoA transferase